MRVRKSVRSRTCPGGASNWQVSGDVPPSDGWTQRLEKETPIASHSSIQWYQDETSEIVALPYHVDSYRCTDSFFQPLLNVEAVAYERVSDDALDSSGRLWDDECAAIIQLRTAVCVYTLHGGEN